MVQGYRSAAPGLFLKQRSKRCAETMDIGPTCAAGQECGAGDGPNLEASRSSKTERERPKV